MKEATRRHLRRFQQGIGREIAEDRGNAHQVIQEALGLISGSLESARASGVEVWEPLAEFPSFPQVIECLVVQVIAEAAEAMGLEELEMEHPRNLWRTLELLPSLKEKTCEAIALYEPGRAAMLAIEVLEEESEVIAMEVLDKLPEAERQRLRQDAVADIGRTIKETRD